MAVWAIAGRADELQELRNEAQFYEEVRVWMGKYDAEARHARGEPIPEDIQRVLNQLVAGAVVSSEVLDIYDAAGIPRPSLGELDAEYVAKAQRADNPHLAIEALRKLVEEESRSVSRHNLVRQRAFSERILELMNRYTNQQLNSTEVIAALVEMAKEVAREADRGHRTRRSTTTSSPSTTSSPPTSPPSRCREGVLAAIARELGGRRAP